MDRCSFVANFYPRPPRGGRPASFATGSAINLISIHALREEGDRTTSATTSCAAYFYPRPPRGGRRRGLQDHCHDLDFYPRPPRGGRLVAAPPTKPAVDFYPRPPRGGRRHRSGRRKRRPGISIHALREEGDMASVMLVSTHCDFYPRPPRGGRQGG